MRGRGGGGTKKKGVKASMCSPLPACLHPQPDERRNGRNAFPNVGLGRWVSRERAKEEKEGSSCICLCGLQMRRERERGKEKRKEGGLLDKQSLFFRSSFAFVRFKASLLVRLFLPPVSFPIFSSSSPFSSSSYRPRKIC